MQLYISRPFEPDAEPMILSVDPGMCCLTNDDEWCFNASVTVGMLKVLIREREPSVPNNFRLRGVNGGKMDDNKFLVDYNVRETDSWLSCIPVVNEVDPSPNVEEEEVEEEEPTK